MAPSPEAQDKEGREQFLLLFFLSDAGVNGEPADEEYL